MLLIKAELFLDLQKVSPSLREKNLQNNMSSKSCEPLVREILNSYYQIEQFIPKIVREAEIYRRRDFSAQEKEIIDHAFKNDTHLILEDTIRILWHTVENELNNMCFSPKQLATQIEKTEFAKKLTFIKIEEELQQKVPNYIILPQAVVQNNLNIKQRSASVFKDYGIFSILTEDIQHTKRSYIHGKKHCSIM